jgi:hypothetical protein
MYETPITVPGIAKLTIVRNSNARRPDEAVARDHVGRQQADERGERRGDRRDLERREQAVHAEPTNIVAFDVVSMPKPCDRWWNVGVMSPRPMSLTRPPVRMTA